MSSLPSSFSRSARVTLYMSCLFAGTGASLPFLGRWLQEERGLSGIETGAVLASAAIVRIAVGPFVAAWADGFPDRRTPLRLLAVAALAAYLVFAIASGFFALFVVGFIAATLFQAIGPLIEGAALRAGVNGPVSFGVMRGIGSAAFIVGNVTGGLLVDVFGAEAALVWLICALAATAAVGVFVLPPDPAPRAAPDASGYRGRLKAGLGLIREPRFVLAVAACGLIQSSHAFFYGFSALAWRDQGIDGGTVGALWAFGVIVEIGFLAMLPRVERRFGPEALIVAGGVGALVRWIAFAFSPPLWLLWPLQALHMLSFAATHVGALRIVFREAPEQLAGFAQTIYAALGAGTLMGLATLASGALYDSAGAGGYWAMAGLAALGLALTPPLLLAPRPSRPSVSPPAPQPTAVTD